jgi:hypothetical protein
MNKDEEEHDFSDPSDEEYSDILAALLKIANALEAQTKVLTKILTKLN